MAGRWGDKKKKDAIAKHADKVGVVTVDPDSNGEVVLRWAGGEETSARINAATLLRPSSEEIKGAVPWCKKDAIAKHGGKVGVVTQDPDSKQVPSLRINC